VNETTTLLLSANGRFTLTKVPTYALSIANDSAWRNWDGTTVSISGDWSFESDGIRISNYGANNDDKIFFNDGSGSNVTLALGIDLGTGDPQCFTFAKKGSGQPETRPPECFTY
jgi:hypothetical protein